MNMAKRPIPRYDFKAFGEAIKTARKGRKESRKKVCDEMYISPRYLANIENKGQHPSLQIFFELMLRYNISVDQFLLEQPAGKNAILHAMPTYIHELYFPIVVLPEKRMVPYLATRNGKTVDIKIDELIIV